MKKKAIQGGDDGTPASEDETNPTGAEAEDSENAPDENDSEDGTEPDDAEQSEESGAEGSDSDDEDEDDEEVVKLTKAELQSLINRTVQKRLARANKGDKPKPAGSKGEAKVDDADDDAESRTPISELNYTKRDHWEDQIEDLKLKIRKLPKGIRNLLPYDLDDEDLTPREVKMAKKWVRRAEESNAAPKKPTVTKETAKKGNAPDPKANRVKDRKLEDLVAEAKKQSRYNSW